MQEADRSESDVVGLIAAEARRHAHRPQAQYFNVLMALRTDRMRGHPPAEAYLDHFLTEGWEIAAIAMMEPSNRDLATYSSFGVPT
jgi:hypothetical protein